MKNMKKCDAVVVALLIFVVAAGWCTAQAKWTPEAWALPTHYLDPVYSDFIGASAYFKSVNDEGFLPFGWKPVSTLAAPGTGGWDRFPTPDEVLLGLFALLFRWCGGPLPPGRGSVTGAGGASATGCTGQATRPPEPDPAIGASPPRTALGCSNRTASMVVGLSCA